MSHAVLEAQKTKECRDCRVVKPAQDYYSGRDRLNSYCRECTRTRIREHMRKKKLRDPTGVAQREWERHIKRNFGITSQEYYQMLGEQGGVCAICGDYAKFQLAIDHCHETGKIRGLLRNRCNGGLGSMLDSIEQLKAAIAYLERHAAL